MVAFKSLDQSFTSGCMQDGWGAKYYFPRCPKEIIASSLDNYLQNLKVGSIFAYQDDAPKLIINKFVTIQEHLSILILCEREGDWCERYGFHPWLICEITFESGFFIHYKVAEFFEKDEADQEFCIKQGRHAVTEI